MPRRGYVKVTNNFYMNPKIRELRSTCPSAVGTYMFAITYASDNLTDGRLSERAMLYVIGATDSELNALCAAGLLEPDGGEGYLIHDYLNWQLSKSQIKKKREDDRKRQQDYRENNSEYDDVTEESHDCHDTVTDMSRCDIGLNTRTQEHKNYSIPNGIEYAPAQNDSDPEPKPKKRRASKTLIPKSWKVNAHHLQVARERNIDIATEAEKFRAYAESNARTYANWDRAFDNWLLNCQNFNRPQGYQNKAQQRYEQNMARVRTAELSEKATQLQIGGSDNDFGY